MAIPAGICVAWPNSVASIPTGWTRETALDGRYILGAGSGADSDLVTDRGATTHTHSSPSHTPTQNPHTHQFSNNAGDADNTIVAGAVGAGGVAADAGHGHDATTSLAETGTNNSASITVDPAVNDLAYEEVIWIRSDGTPLVLPSGCLAFFASDSLPSGWTRLAGDVYLKGAGTGSGGGATGGANTHTHTSPAHTHTQGLHSHGATNSAGGNTSLNERGTGPDTPASAGHVHSVSLDATTPTNQSVTTTIDAADSDPPFKKLNTIQSSSASLPSDIIVLWLGTHAGIPSEWTRFTSMDAKWLKGAATDGESNVVTGGATQHGHNADDCQPTQNAHTHTATSLATTNGVVAQSGAHNNFAADGHNHAAWNVTSDTATNNATTVLIDDCAADAALPKHRTVIYVLFTGTPPVPPRPGVLTVYETGLFETGVNRENVGPKLTPEQEYAIWHGDMRHYPGLLPEGPPR